MLTGAQLGVNVTVATPRGYSPDIEIVTIAREIAQANNCELRLLQDPQAAVEGADAVYTDVCVSMGFEHESTKRAPIFRPFQVNEALMQKAAPHAVFMHCLPARRNDEVTDAVIDGPQSIVFDQAENRMHAQKALLLLLLGGLANTASFQVAIDPTPDTFLRVRMIDQLDDQELRQPNRRRRLPFLGDAFDMAFASSSRIHDLQLVPSDERMSGLHQMRRYALGSIYKSTHGKGGPRVYLLHSHMMARNIMAMIAWRKRIRTSQQSLLQFTWTQMIQRRTP